MSSNDRTEPVLAPAHESLPADDEAPTLEIPAVSSARARRTLDAAEGARVTLVAGFPADDS